MKHEVADLHVYMKIVTGRIVREGNKTPHTVVVVLKTSYGT